MIVLHGAFVEGILHLWGETSGNQKASEEWPYALEASLLAECIKNLGIKSGRTAQLTGVFPSLGGTALPSSSLFGEIADTTDAVLKLWAVPTIMLTNEIASEFLQIEEAKIESGLFYGNDLLYWTQALRFVFRLMVQQRFLPFLENAQAHWKPLLTGEDQIHFQDLARSMPQFCRAFTGQVSSERILLDFVSSFLDTNVEDAVAAPWQQPATVYDSWLASLQTISGPIKAEPDELRSLENSIALWLEPISRVANFHYRVAFRLEEPTLKKEYWYVRYFLQKQDDPTLLIPAAQLWKRKRSARQVLKDDFERAGQILLSELAVAGRIDFGIQMSLHREAPQGYQTDSKGAWEFLETKASILQHSGYGVLLPTWWGRKKGAFRLGLKAKSSTPKTFSGVGKEILIDFDWKFALGEQEITYKELLALAKLKQPLVKFRGKWIALRQEEIASAIDFWKTKELATGSLFDLLKLASGTAEAGGLPVEGVEAEGWLSDFLLNFHEHSKYQMLPAPQGLKGELRPYQQKGYSWLQFMKQFGIGACLADDMGLGKTVQTIAVLLNKRENSNGKNQGNSAGVVLIVCPTSVVGNWQRELSRFAPDLRVEVHHGVGRKKGTDFVSLAQNHDVVISSYALLLRDFETFNSVDWLGVILDEAQNIKNADTKQARAARTLRAGYRIALTGTPVENSVGELWSIMEFLNRGLLGTKTAFQKKYFVPIHKEGSEVALEELKRITSPFILRRLKSDPEVISDLPRKLEMKVYCNLSREQASLYAAVVRELETEVEELEGIERKGKVLAALTRLKQICNHPAHFLGDGSGLEGRSGKLARLTEMLEGILQSNERALIFTQFAQMGELLQSHLQNYFGKEAAFLHGAVARKKREELVHRFHNDPDGPPFFVLSLKAGGTGLNLTGANHVFHFDRWWNPAVEDQATDRAYRIGQKKNVQVHKFVCVGTLEERIDEVIEKKKHLASGVIGTGEGWLTELSTEEIKSLIALGKDAVSV